MSKSLFRMMVIAYHAQHSLKNLVRDSCSAISSQIQSMNSKLTIQLSQIKQILDEADGQRQKHLQIINEESQQDEHEQGFIEKYKKKFNHKINQLRKGQNKIDQILNLYKQQLKDLATKVFEWETVNQKLKFKQKQLRVQNQQLQEQKQQQNQMNHNNIISTSHHLQDKNKWKNLSLKVDTLRKKIEHYQIEVQQKDQLIQQLTNRLKQCSQQNPEHKKLKNGNTSLRAQKTVLNKQITTLKHQIQQQSNLIEAQDLQIRKLKVEIDNLSSTLKWQTNTIEDLKKNSKLSDINLQGESVKIRNLQKINHQLIDSLNLSENHFKSLSQKIALLEKAYDQKITDYKKKIQSMEIILEQKNQSIIRLKSLSSKQKSNDTSYYAELVKVLTKKLHEQEQQMQQLKNLIAAK